MDTDTKLRKVHLKLLRHPETCMYAGVIMMGKVTIEDEIPTACTDGINVRYGKDFIENLTEEELAGLVLHENLHKALRQLMRYRGLIAEDASMANAAMDYVVNDVIVSLKDKALAKLPEGGLVDSRFHNWSVLDVWEYLKSGNPPPPPPPGGGGQGKQGQGQQPPQQGSSQGRRDDPLPKGKPQRGKDAQGKQKVSIGGQDFPLEGTDEHEAAPTQAMDADQLRELDKQIDEAVRQGAMLAGRMGAKIPRVIKDSLAEEIDWRKETQEFFTSSCAGRDDLTFAKYNRRRLADDMYMPSTENETIGEVILGIDTSGSISQAQINVVGGHISNICKVVKPDRVRVLWWDTMVHGQQVFEPNQYDTLAKLLKPVGGGGTRAGSVAEYVRTKKLSADCIVMFTDGYTEQPIDWRGVTCPTLWLVTDRRDFAPPAGNRKVRVRADH